MPRSPGENPWVSKSSWAHNTAGWKPGPGGHRRHLVNVCTLGCTLSLLTPNPQPQLQMSVGFLLGCFHVRATLWCPPQLSLAPELAPGATPHPAGPQSPSPFLPDAGLHSPGHRSLPFLFVILDTQARLRQQQGHPLLTTVPYLHLICMHSQHLSEYCTEYRASGPLPHTAPGREKLRAFHILASASLVCACGLRAEDQKNRRSLRKMACQQLVSRTHAGSPFLLSLPQFPSRKGTWAQPPRTSDWKSGPWGPAPLSHQCPGDQRTLLVPLGFHPSSDNV